MWNNIKLVQFLDGKYGVRRGWFFHDFKDFRGNFWWSIRSTYIDDCKVSKEQALQYIKERDYKVIRG